MPEYPMLRHYLELVTELPWNKVTSCCGSISNLFTVKRGEDRHPASTAGPRRRPLCARLGEEASARVPGGEEVQPDDT